MKQFKAGDKVKRVAGEHHGMVIGDTAIVRYQDGSSYLYLEGYEFSHDPQNFELVQEDEKERIAKFLREEKWWIKCSSQLEFDLINNWLEDNFGQRCQCNPPESLKVLTNFNVTGKKNYVTWNDRDNYPKESEIKLEFETIIKNVQLPEIAPKKTEAQIKLEELQKIIEDAQIKLKQLKEEV